ncbi:hypothetical protein BCY89_25995 [Sphingobacterium siyangense]|uniref:PKD domain-containing protein n=2 Tax=Sphingobacterium TaxID=28453 RepID=A0ABX7CP54_SPHMU|nr:MULTISPECIES: hypothetical protein [Sphingobacterium]QQT30178.1 hypothetical protein I6I99_23135 [Sphingobacterium multivorum]QQT53854.1 hypothetical protein I6I98_00845 [Sphingobacterium multivorum]QRY59021.1 hypothetical protein JVX97_06085 [Sphingobacterium siyangense]RKF39210.1 hypothetical protein BCY89_25995 [Sphingobacterium siyangense]
MLKNHFFISIILFIFTSCAKENYPEQPEVIKPEEESLTTRLTKNMDVWTDNRVINVFEEGKIRVYDKEEHTDHYTFFQLDKEVVDSIVWHIDDIMHYSSGVNPFRTMTGVTFDKPGEYKFNLLVYKDNKVVKKADLTIRAVPGKDFFNVNWGNPPSSSIVGQSYSYKGYRVDQTYVKKQYPYSTVDFYYENKPAKLALEKEKEYLLEVASKTFSSPSLSAGNNGQAELDDKYNMLFKNRFNATTLAIWENRSTAVALIGYPKDNVEHYMIIGEPKY